MSIAVVLLVLVGLAVLVATPLLVGRRGEPAPGDQPEVGHDPHPPRTGRGPDPGA